MSDMFCAAFMWDSSSDMDNSVDRLPMARNVVPMDANMNT
jgi:hypothetical protein